MSDETLPGTGGRPEPSGTASPSFIRHELLTPLNQILGYGEMLKERAEELEDAELAADLTRIEQAGRRLVGLIDRFFGAGIAAPGAAPTEVRAAPIPARTAGRSIPAPGGAPHGSLLVVDDNELNRDMLARRLAQRGYTVSVADGGQTALDSVAAKKPDLILLDVMMPGISGLEVLRVLRRTFSVADLPVIMATARDSSEDIVEALELGANDYVTKPLDFAVVLARIETQISLKRAKDEVEQLNTQLREAQERITRLVESSAQAMQDIPAWAQSIARDLAASIGASEIGIFIVDEERIAPLVPSGVAAPSADNLQLAGRTREFVSSRTDTVIPVFGMTGELFGALVVPGKVGIWDVEERRLVGSFAHQLGGALELARTRKELAVANERRRVTRQGMLEKGVDLLQVCPRCGACYDQRTTTCKADGRPLESPRLLPYRILERYRLVHLRGEGGMGTVFQAYDLKLDRDVAVKIIKPEHFNDPSLRLRFEYEARAVARIDHPGVVGIFDSGELEDGSLFLVMEMLQGKDLADMLRDYGRGTPRQVASLTRQAAAALGAAHRAGLVHRDIKPDNLFLVDQGDGFRVKILDFGVAKQINMDTHLTRTGLIVGTPAYMSPEQVSAKEVDGRSDLYSLAAVVYEALVGRRVTVEDDMARIFVDVLQNDPPPVSALLPGISPEIDRAFTRALAKDPEERPADVERWAASFVHLLERIPSDIPGWVLSRERSASHIDYSTQIQPSKE